MRKKALKKALRSASRPIIKDARGRVPVESEMLKRSLGVKVAQGRRRRSTAYAVIGPRTKFKAKKLEEKLSGTGMERRRPSKYAHLVEFGTESRRLKKPTVVRREAIGFAPIGDDSDYITITRTGATPAQPFLRPAFRNKRRQALREVAKTLRKFMTVEAGR